MKLGPSTPIEVWFQDEMRVGQKNKLTYRWARKGSRPRTDHDQRTQSTYLFGAVCPERGTGAALVLPTCNTEAMQLHLDVIAVKVAPGAHAIVLLDQAGWHGAKALTIPPNISLLPLPPRSPELNSQENIWQFMRQNWLSNRIFKSFDDIVDHCCYAWNTLIDQPWKIMSIANREWATVRQCGTISLSSVRISPGVKSGEDRCRTISASFSMANRRSAHRRPSTASTPMSLGTQPTPTPASSPPRQLSRQNAAKAIRGKSGLSTDLMSENRSE